MDDQGRAFLEAALPHLDAVYRVARHAARDHHHAEDLVQETYLRAFAAFDSHRGPSTTWRAAMGGAGPDASWRRLCPSPTSRRRRG